MMNTLLLFGLLNVMQADTVASPWPVQQVDNLSNSAVTSVFMDRHELIWLGTWDGLDQYDGSSIKVYKPDPRAKGQISNNIVREFLEDGNRNLWIVTHQGINRYDRVTDSFKSYLDSLNDVAFLEYNIRACTGPDSSLWVSLVGKGIQRFSPKADAFVPVRFDGIDPAWLTTVINLGINKGLLYLLGMDGKLICTVNNRHVYSKQLINANQLAFHKFLNINNQYYLAITTRSGEFLLHNLSDMDQTYQQFKLGNAIVSSLSENLARTAIWVGTESGDIFQLTDSKNGLTVQPMNSYFPQFSRDKIKILTITETNQNLVWIGTDGDGIYKFLTRPRVFFSIGVGLAKGQLSHAIVRSIYEDVSGTLYVGTRGGGLNIITPSANSSEVINSQNGLSNNAVLAVKKDQTGNIWVGVDGEGIDMIEADSRRVLHFPRDFVAKPNLVFGSVYSICVDSFNDIWLGTSGYGVVHLKVEKIAKGKYALKEYDQIQTSDGLRIPIKSNIVYSIVEEKPNTLWFGTRGGGIYRYNSISKQIEEEVKASANGLSNNDVLCLYVDKQDQLWVGTSGGLNRVYLQSKPYRISHYTEQERLPNNTVHGILEDATSNIWVSTNRGLGRYDRKKNSFQTYDTNDGLQNNEFTDGASFKSRISERLYFGGINGLDAVMPSMLNSLNYFPRMVVTGFQVRNNPVLPGDDTNLLTTNIDFTSQITLKYDQNFVRFSFTTLDYWNKLKSVYSYRLLNFDKDWNELGHQESITLTNIPPGNYYLQINYRNENGELSPTPRVINLVVTPPFWNTYWAYGIYVLLALSFQLGIILYLRLRTREKRAFAIEKLKTDQLNELNDYKLQFFTNIAHEFRTPLTMIMGPAVSLLHKSNDVREITQLKTIYSNSLRLQKLIEELIQFRKIESGKDQLEISSIDLISFTYEIVESFQQYAADREIQLEFHPLPETLEAFCDPKKVEKVLINLISNAIKYSLKGGIVHVSLLQKNNEAVFEIKDEGVGISAENKDKIFESFYQNPTDELDQAGLSVSTGIGLSLTKSLVQMHGGTIHLQSQLGNGSAFTVSIPIVREFYSSLKVHGQLTAPSSNLKEKILLEFETDHFHTNPYLNTNSSIQTVYPHTLLVVDDNRQIVSLLENILFERYNILKAGSGKEAFACLEDERIDLVISDVLMPDIDGLELCRRIKENIQTSHIPVILLTAKGEVEDRIKGLQAGADSYIPKPFHPEHLFTRIEKLLERMELIRSRFQDSTTIEMHELSTGIGEKDDNFFSKITQCIQLHLSDPEFNAETIGQEVGMSRASLYKKVKAITGLTPHGLIKQFRLKKAAELLRNSKLSVSEVIYETGFNSRSYFYKSFNEMFHSHPKDFK